jgi:DNA-binding MarR family transcriptional regulator
LSLINEIFDSLFQVIPIIHKKLLKFEPDALGLPYSRLHMGIMTILSKQSLPVTDISRRLMIPKPQVTQLLKSMAQRGHITWQVGRPALQDTGSDRKRGGGIQTGQENHA